jgi:hypothetical protein
MSNALTLFKPEGQQEEFVSFNNVLKETYTQAKKQLQEGVNVFKEEFTGMYDKAGSFLHRIAMPVNNFLKDFSQMDAEFKLESYKESLQPDYLVQGGSNPPDQAFLSCGEENY